MNRKILILSTALILPLPVFAFSGEGGHEAPPHHKLEHLNKELQLNDEQKTKLEAIFKEQHEKFQAIHEESHQRIKEVLTPEQITKWEEMQKQHQERHKQMMEKHHQQKPQ